jgi:hypothetical protein
MIENIKVRTKILQIIALCSTIFAYSKKDEPINPNLQTIISKIENLPEKYRPADVKKAMALMLQGKSIWNNISKNKFYSALTLHIQDAKVTNIVKNCLEKSIDRFWIDIHNNKKIQQAIEQANVKFSREMSQQPEYFMFFRMTYLKSMITKEETLKSIENAYQEAIIALQWFLFAQAILENDMFTSAMITIPDQNLYLFYFLDGYAELISPRYRFYSAMSFHSLWQSDAHTQLTGHWKHKKIFKDAAFGINFKNKDKEAQNILPLNNSNLMFGTLDNKLTFIKWQGNEISVLKKPLKILQPKNKSESSINRYDKIPQDVIYQFKSLFKHPITRHQSNLIYKDGISAMLNMLDDNIRSLFINFLEKSKSYNVFDNTLRKGNEIILNPNRFKDFYSIK